MEKEKPIIVMGFEGSANKLGVGIVNEKGEILANVRDTYNAPPGSGFLPNEVAHHHRSLIIKLTRQALEQAKLKPKDLSCLAFTKGYLCSSFPKFLSRFPPPRMEMTQQFTTSFFVFALMNLSY